VISGGQFVRDRLPARAVVVALQHSVCRIIWPKWEPAAGITSHMLDVGVALRAIYDVQFMTPHLALAKYLESDAIRLTNNCS
jgi:hypothetical protein